MVRFNEESIRFAPDGGEQIVRFRGASIDWEHIELETNAQWIEAEWKKETDTEGIVTITLEKNTDDDRTTVIVMYITDVIDGRQRYEIVVNQEGHVEAPYFTITTDSFRLSSAEQVFFTGYDVYRVDNIVSQLPSWITENDPFRYTAAYNSGAERTGTIVLTAYCDDNTTITREITVYQANADEEVIFPSTDIEADYSQQDMEIIASSRGIIKYELVSTLPDWLTADLNLNVDTIDLNLHFDYNSTNFDRSAEVTYLFNDKIEITLSIIQKANVDYLEFPIWKDTKLKFEYPNINYRILEGDNVLYQGRCYGDEVYINRILKSYIENKIDFSGIEFGGKLLDNESYKTFKVQVSLGDTYSDKYIVRTWYDYSYEDSNNHFLSDPISNVIDYRQIFVASTFNSYKDGEQNFLYYDNIGQLTRMFTLEKGVYTYVNDEPRIGEIILDYSGSERRFKVKCTNARYACYYLNTRGGWDSMLFLGRSAVTNRNNTISQYKSDFDNSTKDFQNIDYQKVTKISHKLNTNYLTDEQSKKMHNLLDSTKVYLHNLETGRIFPVTIKTNSYEVKTYWNQKRKLFTYQIEFEESQEQTIR